MGKLTISMAIFSCYVSSPEGTPIVSLFDQHFWLVNRPGELGDTVVGDQAIHFLGPGSRAPGPLDKLYVEPRHKISK